MLALRFDKGVVMLADRRATMVLDNNPRVEIDPAAELRQFWLEEEKRQRPGAGFRS